jgi:diguanylate cyclase (GGDEF)-like protein/PAS domain S-box-containing protein
MKPRVLVLALTLLVVACGGSGSDRGAQPEDPDRPVAHTPDPFVSEPGSSPTLVEPQPGQVDVRPIPWEKAEPRGPRRVEIRFVSGVEPCNVLDHIDVDYLEKEVEITLFEGHAESEEDVACIEIAVEKRTIVETTRRGTSAPYWRFLFFSCVLQNQVKCTVVMTMGSRLRTTSIACAGLLFARLRAALPTGQTLALESWQRRHRAILSLLWAHALGISAYGLFAGLGLVHAGLEGGLVAICAAAAMTERLNRDARASVATLGLVISSATLVHLSDGLIEMHFHFFVVVAVVALYQSWLPFLLAIGFVLFHHGVIGVFDPSSVYNHPDALAHPWKWAAIHALFIAAESGAALTTWKLNENTLEAERASRSALEMAVDDLAEAQALTHIGSWDWDIESDVVVWSDELYRICGVDPNEFTPSYEGFLALIPEEDRGRIKQLITEAYERSGDFEYQTRISRPDGTTRLVHATARAMLDGTGPLRRFVGTLQDITEQKRLEEQVRHQAFHDSLTGLANRDLFRDRVEHARARQLRSSFSLGVLFIDLDDFKQVNDTKGHRSGDEVLIGAAQRILSALRPADTLARVGGDEFAVLLEEIEDVADATGVAERILDLLSGSLLLADDDLPRSASVGVVIEEPSGDRDADGLLRDSDIAMYAAKRKGKGRYEVFDKTMREKLARRVSLKRDLQRAITDDEFFLEYQPIVRVRGERVEALEALVRWRHPERGVVPPNEFIPFAEETGQIVQIEQWVIRRACLDAAGWQRTSPGNQRLRISVNVSAVSFLREGLSEELEAILEETALAPNTLVLEITERVLMHGSESVAERLTNLKRLGVQLAIDDFGTGYSSLSYLKDFPIDLLKIDKSFVDDVCSGPEGSALARAAVKLGGALGLPVVAEGVERRDQAEALATMGCQYAQGFLFFRPVDAGRVDSLLAEPAAAVEVAV